MLAIQDKICRTANKVALDMGYAIGTTDAAVSTARLLDAFAVTADLLVDLRQSEIRDSYQQMCRFLDDSLESLDLNSAEWSARASRQSDLLHRARVHEKTIKIAGDELGRWKFQPIDPEILNSSLDQFEYVALCEAEPLARHWHANGSLSERAATVSRIHCGLTVLAVTLADDSATETEKRYAAANATFGATLVVNGTREILEDLRD